MAEDEAAVFHFCTELHRDKDVTDAAFEKAKAMFGEKGVAELLGICGYYVAVGLTLNVGPRAAARRRARPLRLRPATADS
jgi:4-carboxymuconolactone decarboxylase